MCIQSRRLAMITVNEFLANHHFIHSLNELISLEEVFMRHMENGLNGKPSSMPMIPAYLSAGEMPQGEQNVIVLDAGGTNLRTFLVKFCGKQKPQILYSSKCTVPGKGKRISIDTFFDEIAKQVAPIADQANGIGFCFSFPCTIQPDYDGIILHFDKELTIDGAEGVSVANGLRSAMKRQGLPCQHKVVVLNDTVAALLGALAEHPAQFYSGYIGMILGTGTNCCYQERNVRIGKDEILKHQEGFSIVNMESGNFNAIPMAKPDVMLSKNAISAEQNLSEKMVSGAYQGILFLSMLKCAAEEGLFSRESAENILNPGLKITASDISSFMKAPANPALIHHIAANEEDRIKFYHLADALLERAALLTVMGLTAIMRYTGTGWNPLYPVMLAIEGSTFEHSASLQNKIRSYLLEYTEKKRGYYCRIFSTEDANMVGSGIAVLMAK